MDAQRRAGTAHGSGFTGQRCADFIATSGVDAMLNYLRTSIIWISGMDHFANTGPTSSPDQVVADDELRCIRCGYSLRGLMMDRVCPECGMDVSRSARGDFLEDADPHWLSRVRDGMKWMLAYIMISIAGVVLLMAVAVVFESPAMNLPYQAVAVIGALFGLATTAIYIVAIVMITAREPRFGELEEPVTLRKVILVCAIGGGIGGIIASMGGMIEVGDPAAGSIMNGVGQLLALVTYVAYFGMFVYLRRFAIRIPDARLARQTSTVMWGLIISFVVCVLAVVPMIVAAFSALSPNQGNDGIEALMFIALGVICLSSVAIFVFFIWSIILWVMYLNAFNRAAWRSRLSST